MHPAEPLAATGSGERVDGTTLPLVRPRAPSAVARYAALAAASAAGLALVRGAAGTLRRLT